MMFLNSGLSVFLISSIFLESGLSKAFLIEWMD